MQKRFLVTGCTQGLGRAVALELSKREHFVYAVGRNEALLENLASHSSLIHPVKADVATKLGRDQIKHQIDSQIPISIIHNAAMVKPELFKNLTESLLREYFETNYFAPLLLTHSLLPLLGNQRVMHITSAAAEMALPGLMQYCISKSALEHATRCLNEELNKNGTYFTSVRPGLLDTSMQANLRNSKIDALPNKDFYLQSKNKLIAPDVAAKFVVWVMLETNDALFSRTNWSIHDESHHQNWLIGDIG